MMHAIVVDDEQKGVNTITLLAGKFIADLKIVASATDPVMAIELINDYRPDVVFLDINMPGLNGFEMLEKLSFRSFNLIFTTAHEEYALKALKNNATDYLLKPIDIADLQAALDKVRKKVKSNVPSDLSSVLMELNKNSVHKLAIPSGDGIIYEHASQVLRLEANSNYTHIYLTDGRSYMVAKTMKEFEKSLCTENKNFMRLHQSHIVNLAHVCRYVKEDGGIVVLKDKSQIPLSKNKRDEFLKWLGV